MLLWHAPRSTFAAGGVVRQGYRVASSYLAFMLITYPICWACAEGGNVITVTSEMIWYGIIDIFTIPVFLFAFLWHLRGADYSSFALRSGKYTDKHVVHTDREKGPEPPITMPEPAVATQ